MCGAVYSLYAIVIYFLCTDRIHDITNKQTNDRPTDRPNESKRERMRAKESKENSTRANFTAAAARCAIFPVKIYRNSSFEQRKTFCRAKVKQAGKMRTKWCIWVLCHESINLVCLYMYEIHKKNTRKSVEPTQFNFLI